MTSAELDDLVRHSRAVQDMVKVAIRATGKEEDDLVDATWAVFLKIYPSSILAKIGGPFISRLNP